MLDWFVVCCAVLRRKKRVNLESCDELSGRSGILLLNKLC